jgi:probable F420-dependent oxidoreductase
MFNHRELGLEPAFYKDYAQAVEGAGFDSLSAPEHVVGGHPDRLRGERVHTYDVPYHEPFVLFGYLAAVTTTLELATSILVLPQRQTALVAKQAAELDLLCGGRLRLGVGIGRNWMEYEALNEDFTTRGRRLEEQVEVLRRLWTEELVTYRGRWHHLDRIGLNPMPIQRPIPIWMGTFTKAFPRPIERAARLADGWMPQFPPGDELARLLDEFRGYAVAAGRDPATIGVECVTRITPGDDPATWAATAGAFERLGASGLKVATAGFPTPRAHLDAALAWLSRVRDR